MYKERLRTILRSTKGCNITNLRIKNKKEKWSGDTRGHKNKIIKTKEERVKNENKREKRRG